jgi:hypothetical protein
VFFFVVVVVVKGKNYPKLEEEIIYNYNKYIIFTFHIMSTFADIV